MSNILEIKALHKVYDNGLVYALKDINLSLERGKIYALMGASGCGKSTLLNLIGTLDFQTSGEIFYEGKAVGEVGKLHKFRRDFLGFIFQFHHLIPVLTLRENVESALFSKAHVKAHERFELATNLLEEMGLSHRINSYVSEISGGERQRGAIARALVNSPQLLLADEPTGNVDSQTAQMILKKFQAHVQKTQATLLIATHDAHVGAIADVIIRMKDGEIIAYENNRL